MRVSAVGAYEILGETLDDAAGEAGQERQVARAALPRRGFAVASGRVRRSCAFQSAAAHAALCGPEFQFFRLENRGADPGARAGSSLDEQLRADIARAFQESIVEVLVKKSLKRSRRPACKRW